jgi:hypothetical protein
MLKTNYNPGDKILATDLNDLVSTVLTNVHNILELFLENYFAGKNTPYQGLWFDGFSDTNKACGGSGTTSGSTSSGQNQIVLASSGQASTFTIGNIIQIFNATNQELKTITAISSATLTVDSNLANSYGDGSTVKETSVTIDTADKKIITGSSGPAELASTSLFSDSNLVSYYRMEGNSNDSKGSNNGTDTSITYSTSNGKFGQGAGFGGSSYIDLGNPSNLNVGHISVAFWLQVGSLSADSVPASKYTDTTASWLFYIDGTGSSGFHNKIRFNITRDGTSESFANKATSDDVLTPGVWYHVVGTYDGSTVKLYINGQLQSDSTTVSGSIFSGSANVKIGAWLPSNSTTLPSGSKVDDFAIFSRALTATEVANLQIGNGNQFIYQSQKTHFFEPMNQVKLWLSRKISASYNLLSTAGTGTNTFTLSGDMTSKIKNGDYVEIRDASNNNRQRLTVVSSSVVSGNTVFSTTENLTHSYTSSDFIERVDFLPQVSLVDTDDPIAYATPTLVKSIPATVDSEQLIEDEYQYSPSTSGRDLNVEILVSRNDTTLNPYAKRLGVSLN